MSRARSSVELVTVAACDPRRLAADHPELGVNGGEGGRIMLNTSSTVRRTRGRESDRSRPR